MGVVLALDVGDARIGLAATDEAQEHALAHGTVAAQPRAEAVAAIARLAGSERAVRIVVGLPRTLEGKEGAQAVSARAFGATLAEATSLPVDYVDERFTSSGTEKIARERGTLPDAEAARRILEAWLAQHGKRAEGN